MDPLLTIMMPSYNYAPYLRQAIDSILEQSFVDFELVIVEDGSSDASPQIIREYMSQDKRIRAYFHEKNQGMLECVNQGTQLARGKYIHYLAADDFRYPGFLEKCMDVLIKNQDLELCCTQFHYGNDEKLLLETCGFENDNQILFFEPEEMVEAFGNTLKIFALAAIVKKDLICEYGGFDPKLFYLSDWYLLNQIAFNHPMALIKEPLSRFRIHESNFSNVFRHNKKTKKAAYAHLFAKLNHKENSLYREQIRRSGIMGFIFQDMFWRLLFHPRYISFWPYINRKYPIKEKLKRSLNKKLGKVVVI